ncbi:MAG: hypothetical protein BWY94_02504 [Actinobacteria bacterium ADurb.BinA094]|nr:MAG: hypothetical protein BWY94_02504 [Actinobacteria bacterium ADurb.BinA094]
MQLALKRADLRLGQVLAVFGVGQGLPGHEGTALFGPAEGLGVECGLILAARLGHRGRGVGEGVVRGRQLEA